MVDNVRDFITIIAKAVLTLDEGIPVWLKILASLILLPEDKAGWPPVAVTNIRRLAEHFGVARGTIYSALRYLRRRGWIHTERISATRMRIGVTQKFIDALAEAHSHPPLEIFIELGR